jgi:peptidylprolyl isomerase domain and WD repeat-containing protein 1
MIKMNWKLGFCLSIDERGFLEIWDPKTYDFPTFMKYKYKMETDFLQLLQQNSIPISIAISPHGKFLAVYFKDRVIRVLNLVTGKSVVSINESIKEITRIQEDPTHERHLEESLEETEFHKKMGIEKEIEMSK